MITSGGHSILGSQYLQNCSTIAPSNYISEAFNLARSKKDVRQNLACQFQEVTENILDGGLPNDATVDIGIFNK